MKKLLALLIAVALLPSLVGCVGSENDARWRIQVYLEHKYDGTFQVGEVTYIAPSPDEPFNVGYYTGTALHVETGISFKVVCQVVGTGDVRDNYAEALYSEQAEREIRSVLAQHPAFEVEELELSWYASPEDWDPSVPFEEMEDPFSIDVTLTVQEELELLRVKK